MTNDHKEQLRDSYRDGGQAAERELETVLGSLTSILIQIDPDLTIKRWNPASVQALERTAEQVLGTRLDECGVRWQECDLQALLAAIALGRSSHGHELHFTNDAGELRCLGLTLSFMEADSPGERGILVLARDITDIQRADKVERRLVTAVEQVGDTIVITDLKGAIIYVNPAFERITGYTRAEVIGASPDVLNSGRHDKSFYKELWDTLQRGEVWSGHFTNKRKDGSLYEEDATISPVRNEEGVVTNYVAVKKDVTERLALEIQLRSAQKLESIGQLAAGIAHEINTPTQFISDNARFLRDTFAKLDGLLDLCAKVSAAGGVSKDPAATLAAIAEAAQKANLDFINAEIPSAIEESLSGLSRVTEIVSAMKSFSHPGTSAKHPVDLNEVITTTVTLSTNEWKYVSEIETDLDPALPAVTCLPGEMGQVVLNMVVNAAHAIADHVGAESCERGCITIQTRHVGELAEIRVSDTGCGMPETIRERIFDPFFTTKEVGRGTGQGLAISRSVVVDKHAGTIEVESTPGEGTTFIIRIPIQEVDSRASEVDQAA